MPRTALALSGGGHRASVFGLGVLLYLTDAGQNKEICSIASVSGGSITNALLAQELDYRTASSEELERNVVAPLAGRIARSGFIFASLSTWLYLALLLVVAVCTLVVPWFLPNGTWTKVAAVLVGIPVLGWLAWQRGNACWAAYRRRLFSRDGKATRLGDAGGGVHHVICATDLRTANQVYFTPDFIYGFRLGSSSPGEVTLAKAVQASAAFPAAFPPVRMSIRSLSFAGTRTRKPTKLQTRRLVLADGGVYDNMGDQWARGFAGRASRWPDLTETCSEPETLIIVNASYRPDWTPFGHYLPVFAEINALLREIDVLYENTTAVRRQEMVERFDRAARTGEGLRGSLIMIRQHPWFVPEFFAREDVRKEWPDRALRADAVLEALESEDREVWQRRVKASREVPTTLSALSVETTTALLHHAYVLTMCTLHVILGYPLLAMPPEERFRALAEGRAA